MSAIRRKSAIGFWQNTGTLGWRPKLAASMLGALIVVSVACYWHAQPHLMACGESLASHALASNGSSGLAGRNPNGLASALYAALTDGVQRRMCIWRMFSNRYTLAGLTNNDALRLLAAFASGAVFYLLIEHLQHVRLRRLRTCFENASDAMLLMRVTKDGRFFYEDMNRSWQALHNVPTGRTYGRELHDVWPKAMADGLVAHLQRCVTTGRALHYAWSDHGASGGDVWVVITPVWDSHSRRIVMLLCQARVLAQDVAANGQMPATPHGLPSHGLPWGHDAQLAHEAHSETIRRLAAGVAHDFNNILQAVCSGLELILDDVPSPHPTREMALIALVAARRGSQLTHNLLAYARRQVLNPGPVDLRVWLPQVVPALEKALGPANNLVLIFAGPSAIAWADETALRTALLNLTLNAGRAMSEGGLLRIETESVRDDEGAAKWVRIKLCDSGIGMDEATLARCPEPFFTTRGLTATGLGLSMVQGFAAQSGGMLRLSSRLGEGTTATLTLPAYCAAAAETARRLPCQRDSLVGQLQTASAAV